MPRTGLRQKIWRMNWIWSWKRNSRGIEVGCCVTRSTRCISSGIARLRWPVVAMCRPSPKGSSRPWILATVITIRMNFWTPMIILCTRGSTLKMAPTKKVQRWAGQPTSVCQKKTRWGKSKRPLKGIFWLLIFFNCRLMVRLKEFTLAGGAKKMRESLMADGVVYTPANLRGPVSPDQGRQRNKKRNVTELYRSDME